MGIRQPPGSAPPPPGFSVAGRTTAPARRVRNSRRSVSAESTETAGTRIGSPRSRSNPVPADRKRSAASAPSHRRQRTAPRTASPITPKVPGSSRWTGMVRAAFSLSVGGLRMCRTQSRHPYSSKTGMWLGSPSPSVSGEKVSASAKMQSASPGFSPKRTGSGH